MLTVEQAAPGDVDAIRTYGYDLQATATAARQARTELQGIGTTCQTIPFEGRTADSFQLVVAEMPLDVDKLATGYERVSGALLQYATALSVLKTRAATLFGQGTAAVAQSAVLRTRRAGLQGTLNAAMWSHRSAQGNVISASTDPSPGGAARAASAAADAAAAAQLVSSLHTQIADVDRQLATQHGILQRSRNGLEDVRDEARAAGSTAAREVRDAADNSWRDRGFSATLGSVFDGVMDAVGVVGAVIKGITKTKLAVDVAGWAAATVRGLETAGDLTTTFLRQATDIPGFLRRAMTAVRLPTTLIDFAGRAASVLGRFAWPLTFATGLMDVIKPGHEGWRGVATRIMGGVGMAGAAVLGTAALAAAGVITVTIGAPVLIAAGVAVAAYGLWSAGNAIVDNWPTIQRWGGQARDAISSGFSSAARTAGRAADAVGSTIMDVGRGIASGSVFRGLGVF